MSNQWDLSELRPFVEETLKQWLVSGVAIAIALHLNQKAIASPKKKSDCFP